MVAAVLQEQVNPDLEQEMVPKLTKAAKTMEVPQLLPGVVRTKPLVEAVVLLVETAVAAIAILEVAQKLVVAITSQVIV